jgi:two-component system, response regulator RegA
MPARNEPQRLFLVEDDASNRLTLSALLEDEGFAVETAGSLAEASSRIRRAPAFAAILLDRRLGDGDGLSAVPLIRSAMPGAKILVLSGEDAPVPEVDATLWKGEPFDALLARLQQLF